MNPLQMIAAMDLSVTSYSRAVQEASVRYDTHGALNAIIERLAPTMQRIADHETAKYVVGYLIQDIVKGQLTRPLTDEECASVLSRAVACKAAGYMSTLYDSNAILHDEEGNVVRQPKSRTVSAARRAQEIYNDLCGKKDRTAIIAAMIEETGVSDMTAASYYWAANKERRNPVKSQPKKTARTRTASGKSRTQEIREVWESRSSWTSRAEFLDAVVAATGMPRSSANTFSYAVMPSSKPRPQTAP